MSLSSSSPSAPPARDCSEANHLPDRSAPPDRHRARQQLGSRLLEGTFYVVVAFVVGAALVTRDDNVTLVDLVFLVGTGAIFLALPFFIGWITVRHQPEFRGTDDLSWPRSWKPQCIYLFLMVPSGVLLCGAAVIVGSEDFSAMIPVFVLAGYAATLFGVVGMLLSMVYVLGVLQLMFTYGFSFSFSIYELLGMSTGALVFNAIFMIARSAEQARLHAAKLATELEAKNAELRAYALKIEDLAVTEERNRLAREIHDSIGHALTVVNVQVEAARTVLESDPSKARAALEAAQAYTRQGLKEVREAVSSLRDSPLAKRTLVEATESIVEEARKNGLEAQLRVEGTPLRLAAPIEHTLLRAAQEALTNTLRHAGARGFSVRLEYQPTTVRLTLEDDGRGAELGQLHGFGLLGLRERVGHHGGELRLESSPGSGFVIRLEMPTPSS